MRAMNYFSYVTGSELRDPRSNLHRPFADFRLGAGMLEDLRLLVFAEDRRPEHTGSGRKDRRRCLLSLEELHVEPRR